jgi:hypothetical protein
MSNPRTTSPSRSAADVIREEAAAAKKRSAPPPAEDSSEDAISPPAAKKAAAEAPLRLLLVVQHDGYTYDHWLIDLKNVSREQLALFQKQAKTAESLIAAIAQHEDAAYPDYAKKLHEKYAENYEEEDEEFDGHASTSWFKEHSIKEGSGRNTGHFTVLAGTDDGGPLSKSIDVVICTLSEDLF